MGCFDHQSHSREELPTKNMYISPHKGTIDFHVSCFGSVISNKGPTFTLPQNNATAFFCRTFLPKSLLFKENTPAIPMCACFEVLEDALLQPPKGTAFGALGPPRLLSGLGVWMPLEGQGNGRPWRIIPVDVSGLVTIVIISPLSNSGCGTPSKWPFPWLINGGDPNHLPPWMILQVLGDY